MIATRVTLHARAGADVSAYCLIAYGERKVSQETKDLIVNVLKKFKRYEESEMVNMVYAILRNAGYTCYEDNPDDAFTIVID